MGGVNSLLLQREHLKTQPRRRLCISPPNRNTTMNLLNKLLAVVLAASSATAAQADSYVAQSITVTTTDKGSTAMKLLGTTAAGNQVWSCSNNDVAGGKGATWTIDSGTAISASEANFAPTYPVNSTSLSTKFDESKGRQFTSVTSPEQYHFLKVNSQTSADFFVWNMENLQQSKIEDFILSPTVTLTGSDVAGCTDDVSRATHVVSWTVTGLTSEAIDHLTLRWSYNGGRTWEADSLCNLTGSENSCTVTHPFAQDSVRYQIAVYPKSCYRIVTDKSMWRSAETAEYDISCTKRVVFNATKVEKREVGTGFKENFTDMSLLGITQDGHQILSLIHI